MSITNAYGYENKSTLLDPLKQPSHQEPLKPEGNQTNRKNRQMISIEKVEKRRSIFSESIDKQRDSITLSTHPQQPITRLENIKHQGQNLPHFNQSVIVEGEVNLQDRKHINKASIMNNQNISSALSQDPQIFLSTSQNNDHNTSNPQSKLRQHAHDTLSLNFSQNAANNQPIQNLIIKRCEFKSRPEHLLTKKYQYYSVQRNSLKQMRQLKQLKRLEQDLSIDSKLQRGNKNNRNENGFPNTTQGLSNLVYREGLDNNSGVVNIYHGGADSQTLLLRESLTKAKVEQNKKKLKEEGGKHKACQRFLERGNKPVPSNYEVLDVLPAIDSQPNHHRLNYYSSGENTASASGIGTKSFNRLRHQSRQFIGFGANKQLLSGIGGTISGLNLDEFDEEINGVNLGKLFSVYGPNSIEQRKYQRRGTIGRGSTGTRGQDRDRSEGLRSGRSSSLQKQINNNKIPNQDLDASYPQNNKNYNRNSFSGGKIGYNSQGYENINNTFSDFDVKSNNEFSQEREEPIVIRLMSSMFSKKKSVKERLQMLPNISLDKLRRELAQYKMEEKVKQNNQLMENFMIERQLACEKLFQKFDQMKKEKGFGEELEQLREMVQAEQRKRIRENPFYMALKANKDKRERLKQLRKQRQIEEEEFQKMMFERKQEEAQLRKKAQEKDQTEIFAHTFVDYDDNLLNINDQTEQEYKGDIMNRPPKDVFTFMNLNFDLPTTYYQSFGDFSLPNDFQKQLLRQFMLSHWPQMRTKKVNFKVAFDPLKQIFNVILLGKNCPLSKCCKMTVNFQFDREIAGGKVICMETLCPYNPIDQFFMNLDLMNQLYSAQSIQPDQNQIQNLQLGITPVAENLNQDILVYDQNRNDGVVRQSRVGAVNLNNKVEFPQITLKPKVQKVLSNEVSKSIQKGIYKNQSLREVLINRHAQGNFSINKKGMKINKEMISHLFSSDGGHGFDESTSRYNVLMEDEAFVDNEENYKIIDQYHSKEDQVDNQQQNESESDDDMVNRATMDLVQQTAIKEEKPEDEDYQSKQSLAY